MFDRQSPVRSFVLRWPETIPASVIDRRFPAMSCMWRLRITTALTAVAPIAGAGIPLTPVSIGILRSGRFTRRYTSIINVVAGAELWIAQSSEPSKHPRS